jgi:hypothetical protein
MKVRIQVGDVDEIVAARDAGDLLAQAKAEAARRAPFLLRGMVRGLSDAQFAGEVVKRANAAAGHDDPSPRSAQEFLDWALRRGYATILEE